MPEFIVIEKHGGPERAKIITDENGKNKVFDTWAEADKEASGCRDGLVIVL